MSSSFSFFFSEKVTASSGKNITVTPQSANGTDGTAITFPVTDSARVSVANARVAVSLAGPLQKATKYSFSIPAGAFVDAKGNQMSAFTSYNAIRAAKLTKVTLGTNEVTVGSQITTLPEIGRAHV